MKIEILGTGCGKCGKTFENAKIAIKNSGKDVELEKVEEIKTIMGYGVMQLPGVVIDGKVVIKGKVASVKDIEKYL